MTHLQTPIYLQIDGKRRHGVYSHGVHDLLGYSPLFSINYMNHADHFAKIVEFPNRL
jgi:hypothetical protein